MQIFSIENESDFEETALQVFNYQAEHCAIYRNYIQHLGINPKMVHHYRAIPFLPISFFKTHAIISKAGKPDITFTSSGTTGQTTSKHLVSDVELYKKSFTLAFEQFYRKPDDICILALLPSYLEREGSSLIYMVDELLKQSKHPYSGYFLHNLEQLAEKLNELKQSRQCTMLIGVTYALLDLIEQFHIDFPELIVMETGGMKGKRKELVREELHQMLSRGFGVEKIHSEYGMTELLSQAYSNGDGIFYSPNWMKVLLRDTSDPLSLVEGQKSGGINVIDLANIYSCSFIATQDLGKNHLDGGFEVLGRFDNADIRGCNLLLQ